MVAVLGSCNILRTVMQRQDISLYGSHFSIFCSVRMHSMIGWLGHGCSSHVIRALTSLRRLSASIDWYGLSFIKA